METNTAADPHSIVRVDDAGPDAGSSRYTVTCTCGWTATAATQRDLLGYQTGAHDIHKRETDA